MTQLEMLKVLLDNPPVIDSVLEFYLDVAKNIICDIRFTHEVEDRYKSTQVDIAKELFYKRGAEGQTGHGENGLSRSYESADISPSLINRITPFARTPYSSPRWS